jgi:hypothetical protein
MIDWPLALGLWQGSVKLLTSPAWQQKRGKRKRSKIICSPSYADIRSRTNTRGLNFDHMIKREHTREV